jgi:hypothetical protein
MSEARVVDPNPSPTAPRQQAAKASYPLPPGEDLFGEAAGRLAGLAGALLGWRPDEFWKATPGELAAVLGAMMPEGETASADDLARLKEMFPDG